MLRGTHFDPQVVDAFAALDRPALLAPIEHHRPPSEPPVAPTLTAAEPFDL